VEPAFVLLVFLPLGADVLVNTFALHINLRADLIVVSLLLVVGLLNLRVAGTESSELLDLRGKSVLLLFDLRLDLNDQLVELLKGLTLGVIKLLFEFRDTFHLLLHVGESLDSMLLLKLSHDLVSVVTARFQDRFSSLKHNDFSLDFIEDLLHDFEVGVLDAEVGGVLLE